MKALLIYDSYFGNTEKIALAIGDAVASQAELKTVKMTEVTLDQLSGIDLLILGSPTRQFSASESTRKFIKSIPVDGLKNIKAAVFDTRVSLPDIKSGFFRFIIKLGGFAAEPMYKQLAKKGAAMIAPPAWFDVKDSEGPLKDGELERATEWGKLLLEKASE